MQKTVLLSPIQRVFIRDGKRAVIVIRREVFTASTPVLLDSKGIPLAMTPEFSEDPDAMFILWKDHSAVAEADEITKLAHKWNVDYTSYSGGAYSAEWAWSKVLHVLRTNSRVAQKASSWIEHCDWIVSWLTGAAEPAKVLHSRCAAGHKAMWNQDWQGLPSEDFLSSLDPRLALFRRNMYENTFTSDVCAGILSKELAVILGLPYDVKIAVGSVDAHVGAVGASVAEGVLTRIMGTSTCDILVKSYSDTGERRLNGICGQVKHLRALSSLNLRKQPFRLTPLHLHCLLWTG